jgi:threonine dehydratase
MVTLKDVLAARERIRGNVIETPCPHSQPFSTLAGAQVWFKLENLHPTGSFKERGAANKLSQLTADERARGVIAASAGNHAQGVAVNAQRLGIPCTIVMPESSPLVKVTATKRYGAKVVLHGANFDEAFAEARRLEKEKGLVFIHAFDDDAIIAGQGTCALEIVEQVPDLDVLVCSIGGGGLLGGMAVVLRELRPKVRIVGVESAQLPKMRAAVDAGCPVVIPPSTTIADGIAIRRAGDKTLPLMRDLVDDLVTVDDEEVANAILLLIEREKTVAEGAGAVATAALLQKKVPGLTPQTKVVCVVSGGNIDVNLISRIIERGLVKEGRRVMLAVRVPDRPGSLAGILGTVANEKANVIEVHHERAFLQGPVGDTEILLTLETKGPEHVESLKNALNSKGYKVVQR